MSGADAACALSDFRWLTVQLHLRPVQPELRVDNAGVLSAAGRWAAAAGELPAASAPAGLGSSSQASAAAVAAAHADIMAFTAALAGRIGTRATGVVEAAMGYIANEAHAAEELGGLTHPVIGG